MINGKYYDFGTPNTSFLKTAYELKQLGIKNYYFMLEIKDPRVANIDPYKSKITKQEIVALLQEATTNLWFYAREIARIRSDVGVHQFELHRGLAAALWCFLHGYAFCLCQPRQTWKTSGTTATIVAWAFQLSQNLHIHFFGKDQDNTKRNLGVLRDCVDVLPTWLQFKKFTNDEGKIKTNTRSVETLKNRLMHNDVTIHPKPVSVSHAQGMARGASAAILYFDEIEHTPFFGELLSNSAPAFKTAADNAKSTGKPYGRIFTTTPGNLDNREGMETLPIIKSMPPWTELLYDKTPEEIELYKSAYKDEYNQNKNKDTSRDVIDIFYVEYQYYQVRKSHDWVIEQYKLVGDKMAVRREILLQRLRGSNNSPLSPEDIEYLISNMVKSDKDLLINGKWKFKLYDHDQGSVGGQVLDLDPKIPYLIGVDPAAGGGGDNTAIVVINPYNLKIAAEFKNPYISGTDVLRVLNALITEYMPNAVLTIEKNSLGVVIIDMICESPGISSNLYWSENAASNQLENLTIDDPETRMLKLASLERRKYGTYLTRNVRGVFIEILFKMINDYKSLINTEYLVDDICKLVRTNTGRIEAVQGEHDDVLFAYLHALYVFFYGDNIHTFGIDPFKFKAVDEIFEGNQQLYQINQIDLENEREVTYEDLREIAGLQQDYLTQALVNKFDFIKDRTFSKQEESYDDYHIDPVFFDICNDTLPMSSIQENVRFWDY